MDRGDIVRAAAILIERHGKDAPREALKRASQRAKEGDTEGVAAFHHVAAGVASC